MAYLITRGIVAYLGEHAMTITSYANVLLVVVMYGAGTDYCLFLISRFREEMADDPGVTAGYLAHGATGSGRRSPAARARSSSASWQ